MDSIANTMPAAIAEQINAEHEACCKAANNSLEHAIRCGKLLAKAKATIVHGDWQQWLADNFNGSARTARLYLQLVARRAEIEAKRQRDTVLSVREARRLIIEAHRESTVTADERGQTNTRSSSGVPIIQSKAQTAARDEVQLRKAKTLDEVTEKRSRRRIKAGKETTPVAYRKAALVAFGRLMRAMTALGRGEEVRDNMKSILTVIKR